MTDNDIFNELTEIFKSVEAEKIIYPQDRDVAWLVDRYNELDRWLISNKQVIALNPDTQEARNVHSERNAIKLELIKRGLL